MTEHPHEDVRRLFDMALDVPAAQRESVLERECAGDEGLKRRILAMIAAAEDDQFLGEATASEPHGPNTANDTIASTPREQVGQMIGRYKLLEQIGEGGFGTVWAAEQREPVKRRVALKIIKLGMDTKQVIARFEAERQALAMMDHSNIAKVLDAGSTDTGRPFFVMELVRGVPILDYCDSERLDTKSRLDLFMKVCHAIQHAHQKGIIHRDIKPSNVLVTLHDGVPVPKVIDFGIAKATNQELTDKTLFTQHRQMIGTPAYMSPEQAEMSGLDIDTRSDIYSLGVLLYELLTGTTPFATEELMSKGFAEMMRIIREETPHKPSTRLSSLGETGTRTALQRQSDIKRLGLVLRGDLDWIVMKCLEKDRGRRYDTANSLAADIQRHLSDEPVTAGPPSAGYRLRKFVRRNRGPVLAGAAFTTLVLIGVTALAIFARWALAERARVTAQAATASAAMREANGLVLAAFKDVSEQYGGAARRELPIDDPSAYAGMEVGALGIASRNLAIFFARSLKEEAASRRAAERIASFQEARLGDVDVERMGIRLRATVVAAASDEDREALQALLEAVNFTDIARASLDQSIFQSTLAAIDEQFASEPVVRSQLLQAVASSMRQLGLYDGALPPQQQALALRREALGAEHADTADSEFRLATLLQNQGEYPRAEALFVRSLEARRAAFGETDSRTLAVATGLGNLYVETGQRDRAEPLLRSIVEERTRSLGSEDPLTLDAVHNLALYEHRSGNFAEAHRLNLQTLEIRDRILEDSDPDLLASLNNTGLTSREFGDYAASQTYYERLVALSANTLGQDHPTSLIAAANLAGVMGVRGEFDSAETLFRQTLSRMRGSLGSTHPATVSATADMATMLSQRGRIDEADATLREALDASTRSFGPEHRKVLKIRAAIAGNLILGRRYAEGEQMLNALLADQERILSPDDPDRLASLSTLAALYFSQQRFPEADALFPTLIEAQSRVLGPDSPAVLQTRMLQASAHLMQGRMAEAEPILESVYATRVEILGEFHPVTATTSNALAMLYMSQGRTDDADSLMRSALEAFRRSYGNEHPSTLGALANLARLNLMLGRQDQALALSEECVPIMLTVLGPDHQWTTNAVFILTSLYRQLGRDQAAEELERQVAAAREQRAQDSTQPPAEPTDGP